MFVLNFDLRISVGLLKFKMSLEEVKSSRSQKKRRVTILINKLKGSLQYGDGSSSLVKTSLEVEMDNLSELHLQVEELDELDDQYLESISRQYAEVMELFRRSESQDAEIAKQKMISSMNRKIDRSFFNVETIIERLNKTLSLTNLSQGEVMGMEVDNKLLIEEVSQLMEKVSSLGELSDLGKLEGRVDEVLQRTEQVKRDTAVRLRLRSSGTPSAELDDGSETHQKELFPSTHTPPPHSSLSPDAHSFTPSLAHSIASLSIGMSSLTKTSPSVVGVLGAQGEARVFLPPTSSIPAPFIHPSGYSSANAGASGMLGCSLESNTLPSWSPGHVSYSLPYAIPTPFNHPSGYSLAYAGASGMQGCSLGSNTLPSMSSGHMSYSNPYTISAPVNHLSGFSSANTCASCMQKGSAGINTLPSMSPGHMSYSVPYSMDVPSNHHSGYNTTAAYSMGIQGRDLNTTPGVMGPYPSGTSLGTGPSIQNLGNFQGPINSGPFTRPDVIHTKRPSLPIFSGDRAEWPEFRCLWISLAESQFSNKVLLAMELKRCCKGKAADRVRHIYVTNEHAYEEIWKRLSEEYDDPGLSSQEAINRLRSLKPVSDQDFAGLVNVIDTVDNIYNQLRELNQLNAVHSVDVDSISSRLPGTTHMEWLRKYSDLSPVEKMAPFSAFVAFLRRERTAVARLAETMPLHIRQVKKSFSHQGLGADRRYSPPSGHSGKVKTCAVHQDTKHLTRDCPDFLQLSVSQRYNCLRKSKRCFNCLETHLRDQCSAPGCAVCGKRHHRLLCAADPSSPEHKPPSTEAIKVDTGSP